MLKTPASRAGDYGFVCGPLAGIVGIGDSGAGVEHVLKIRLQAQLRLSCKYDSPALAAEHPCAAPDPLEAGKKCRLDAARPPRQLHLPMSLSTATRWQLVAEVRGTPAAVAVFSLLDEGAAALSAFETAAQTWRIELYSKAPLLAPPLAARLNLAAAAAEGELVEIFERLLPERDWLAENRLAFPPLRIGRFFIHGAYYRGRIPVEAIRIAVDAAAAFGTGEHPSTRGCLLALEGLAKRRRFRRPVDVGAGTGILAIAAAKRWHRPVVACDLDRGSVRIARHNTVRNGVAGLVRVGHGSGYHNRQLHGRRSDLVFANILARPLALMAADLPRRLAPGGRAVLSGLLRRQEPIVLAPHRGCGIVLERRILIDGWSTLVLRRRRRA